MSEFVVTFAFFRVDFFSGRFFFGFFCCSLFCFCVLFCFSFGRFGVHQFIEICFTNKFARERQDTTSTVFNDFADGDVFMRGGGGIVGIIGDVGGGIVCVADACSVAGVSGDVS